MSDSDARKGGDLVEVGFVTKSHGVRGCVKVLPFSAEFESFLEIKRVFLKSPETGELREFEVLKSSRHKQFFLVQLKGITNINEAEAFRNWIVCVQKPEHWESELGEDEYYYSELIDMQAYSTRGEFLGRIEGFIETPAHDVMVIRDKHKEFMLPMIDGVLVEVDRSAKRVVLLTEGLLVEND